MSMKAKIKYSRTKIGPDYVTITVEDNGEKSVLSYKVKNDIPGTIVYAYDDTKQYRHLRGLSIPQCLDILCDEGFTRKVESLPVYERAYAPTLGTVGRRGEDGNWEGGGGADATVHYLDHAVYTGMVDGREYRFKILLEKY